PGRYLAETSTARIASEIVPMERDDHALVTTGRGKAPFIIDCARQRKVRCLVANVGLWHAKPPTMLDTLKDSRNAHLQLPNSLPCTPPQGHGMLCEVASSQ